MSLIASRESNDDRWLFSIEQMQVSRFTRLDPSGPEVGQGSQGEFRLGPAWVEVHPSPLAASSSPARADPFVVRQPQNLVALASQEASQEEVHSDRAAWVDRPVPLASVGREAT